MTEPDAPRRLLVLAGPADHQIAVCELPESGELVVDDLTEATRIGDLNGDAQPLVLTIDGERYVIVGGSSPGGDPWDRVEVRSPGPSPRLAFTQMCRVRNDVWLSFPEPFREGMEVTVAFCQGDTVLFERESGPLEADALEPMFGPGWTGYAPMEEGRERGDRERVEAVVQRQPEILLHDPRDRLRLEVDVRDAGLHRRDLLHRCGD